MYRCVNDSYDRTGDLYEDVEDFLAMCKVVYGIRPELFRVDGNWYDEIGSLLVLALVDDRTEGEGHDDP